MFVCTTNRSGFSFKSLKWNVNICCKKIKIRKLSTRYGWDIVRWSNFISHACRHTTPHTHTYTLTHKKIIKAHSAAYLPFLFYLPEEREYENCLMFLNSFFSTLVFFLLLHVTLVIYSGWWMDAILCSIFIQHYNVCCSKD